MEKVKAIFFDVDGTLINYRTNQVDQSTKETLVKLKTAGYLLFIATGRSLSAAKDARVVDLVEWDGYVCNNGQVVYDKDFNVLSKTTIPTDLIVDLNAKAKERGIALLFQGDEWLLDGADSEHVQRVHEQLGTDAPVKEEYALQDVYTFMIYGTDYSLIDQYPTLQTVTTHFDYADVMLKDFNKNVGIKHLLQAFNLTQYMAIGDSLNDVEMLKGAKVACAMNSAPCALIDVATVHSQATHDEISIMVEKLKLI